MIATTLLKAIFKFCTTRPGATGGHSGVVPAKLELCPPSEDCAPNKVTCLGLRLRNTSYYPRIRVQKQFFLGFCNSLFCLVFTSEFVGKNRFFLGFVTKTFLVFTSKSLKFRAYFAMKMFVFWSSMSILRENSFCAPPKNCLCPPSHATPVQGICVPLTSFSQKIIVNGFRKFCCYSNCLAEMLKVFEIISFRKKIFTSN